MIASLPMYDLPPTAAATDRLWAAIRDQLRGLGLPAPEALTRGPAALWPSWEAADLVLSQTCGMPYRLRLHDRVTLVGTPDYGVEGCPPGHYRSLFVARLSDPRDDIAAFDGAAMAYNEKISQSGWAAPLIHAAQIGITLTPALHTGGHAGSLVAVAEGRAEIAALDAVSFRIFGHFMPEAQQVRVVGMTDPTPGLPLIAAAGAPRAALFAAVAAAIAGMGPADRNATGLKGIVAIPPEAYLAVPNPAAG
jgi:ABC-type phosphate/phosphonate transport system substrate-binding protein